MVSCQLYANSKEEVKESMMALNEAACLIALGPLLLLLLTPGQTRNESRQIMFSYFCYHIILLNFYECRKLHGVVASIESLASVSMPGSQCAAHPVVYPPYSGWPINEQLPRDTWQR